ncbi:hypothetical protein H6G97_43030 [Nostoc flagelliforme FACHB-838]|uniref:Uncharacterized protein n=1 Tax=Nostoc flagelliforme FACHB-838 TaxID=2692904 RepID=A0ABR8E5I5_9NOSO|nr:hypothetical protein [Nostoc flagelliforme]MBD2535770.1 hypothetical protein [Nostoc flagelliforme FACHB-838]
MLRKDNLKARSRWRTRPPRVRSQLPRATSDFHQLVTEVGRRRKEVSATRTTEPKT